LEKLSLVDTLVHWTEVAAGKFDWGVTTTLITKVSMELDLIVVSRK
jgi:hypothetical protein